MNKFVVIPGKRFLPVDTIGAVTSYDREDIQNGRPIYGLAIGEKYTPHEITVEWSEEKPRDQKLAEILAKVSER